MQLPPPETILARDMSTIPPHELALLKHSAHWRRALQRNTPARNKTASRKLALNLIEGLVFLKLARQRRLESTTLFSNCLNAASCVRSVEAHFSRAAKKYHSTVFDLPTLPPSPNFERALRKVVQKLSAFRIGKMEPSILGHIYATDPDGDRKGVHFTPDFISTYLVTRTLAPLLSQKKSPTVLDPACGAGAFPLKIFEQLIQARACKNSLPKKRRLLLQSIHAVDIDAFGVELTKLSLLLELFDGTPPAPKDSIPDLSKNIRCGNTLVASRFAGVNPLPFPRAKFDALIVNPPYLSIHKMTRALGAKLQRYLARNYTCARGAYHLYVLFLERSLALLRPHGRLGIIFPSQWTTETPAEPCRAMILKSSRIESLADMSPMCVFSKKSLYPHLLICQKTPPKKAHRIAVVEVFSRTDLQPGAATTLLIQSALSFRDGFHIHEQP